MAISSVIGSSGNAGLVFLNTTTWASGAITQSFDTKFTSAYSNYKVILTVLASGDDISLTARMRASTVAQSLHYKTAGQNQYPGPTTPVASGSNSATAFDMGVVSATDTIISFDIFRPQEAKITVLDGFTDNIQSAFGNTVQWFKVMGHLNTTAAYDGMQFTLTSGTFTGTATIYGYRK